MKSRRIAHSIDVLGQNEMLLFRTHGAKAERMIRNNNVLPQRDHKRGTITALQVTDALHGGWRSTDKPDRFRKAIALSVVVELMASRLKHDFLELQGLQHDWA